MEIHEDILNYLEIIDQKYLEAKKKRLSRFSIEWGTFSRGMNLEIREKIEKKEHPQIPLLKSVFQYWLVTSELLELHFKSKILKQAKKKQLSKQRRAIKDDILGGNAISELSIKEMVAKSIRQGK
jgi:hypothetical protein